MNLLHIAHLLDSKRNGKVNMIFIVAIVDVVKNCLLDVF